MHFVTLPRGISWDHTDMRVHDICQSVCISKYWEKSHVTSLYNN